MRETGSVLDHSPPGPSARMSRTPPTTSEGRDVRLSKALSWLLRHSGEREGLVVRRDGFVVLSDILRHRAISSLHATVDDVRRVVISNAKQRFSLMEEEGMLFIRANQGHSIEGVSGLALTAITDASEVGEVVHGTFQRHLPSILQEGLKRMQRNHIHFADGLDAISGIRRTCDVLIYLDVARALQEGMRLYRSANGVILTEGFDGVVPPLFFQRTETLKRSPS